MIFKCLFYILFNIIKSIIDNHTLFEHKDKIRTENLAIPKISCLVRNNSISTFINKELVLKFDNFNLNLDLSIKRLYKRL